MYKMVCYFIAQLFTDSLAAECRHLVHVSDLALSKMSLSKPKPQFQSFSFAEIFGSQVVTRENSESFVMKLAAVSVASIAYTRFLFPAHWFHMVDISGVKAALFNRKAAGPQGDHSRPIFVAKFWP